MMVPDTFCPILTVGICTWYVAVPQFAPVRADLASQVTEHSKQSNRQSVDDN